MGVAALDLNHTVAELAPGPGLANRADLVSMRMMPVEQGARELLLHLHV